jgi:hypothetical protein
MAHWLAPPLPPNRTCGFPASGSPVGDCPRTSGPSRDWVAGMGDRSEECQPLPDKVGIWITLMIEAPASTSALVPLAQDAAQSHAQPLIELFRHIVDASLEVIAPASNRAIEPLDDHPKAASVVAPGVLPDRFLKPQLALFPRPAIAAFEMPAEKVKTALPAGRQPLPYSSGLDRFPDTAGSCEGQGALTDRQPGRFAAHASARGCSAGSDRHSAGRAK